LKSKISNNEFGTIYSFHLSCLWNRPDEYYTEWRGTSLLDGGTLYTQFSHYIDAMVWIFGEIDDAKGWKKNAAHKTSIHFEDTGTAALNMKNGTGGFYTLVSEHL
jgi:predicted dehydrogenase